MATLSVGRVTRTETAFTAALTFLADRPPFASMRVGALVPTVAGAVRRGHYGLAMEEGRVRGVLLWALSDEAGARRWIERGDAPDFEGASHGDTVVVLLGAADDPRVPHAGFRELARRHPGLGYVMRRHSRGGYKRGRLVAPRPAPQT